jgi:hypothetical protein
MVAPSYMCSAGGVVAGAVDSEQAPEEPEVRVGGGRRSTGDGEGTANEKTDAVSSGASARIPGLNALVKSVAGEACSVGPYMASRSADSKLVCARSSTPKSFSGGGEEKMSFKGAK